MTELMEHDDIFAGHEDGESSGYKMMSFKDELREMSFPLRVTIYACIFCWVMLCIQCLFIMPAILYFYGWGYSAPYIFN